MRAVAVCPSPSPLLINLDVLWGGVHPLAVSERVRVARDARRYTYELAYVEKKAIKHKRRHRRRKHTIPWEKIKIVGPVTNCGATGPPGGATGASKCPVGFGSAKKDS